MKKTLLQNIKIITFAIVLALGVSYAMGRDWVNQPAGSPPSNYTAPIDTGSLDQIKTGDLTVNQFEAMQDSVFALGAYLQGVVRGGKLGDTGPTTLQFGDASRVVDSRFSGTVTVGGDMTTTALANNSVTPLHICADTTGTLVLCNPPAATDLCSNITGTQSTIPAGYWHNSDNTCGKPNDVCSNLPGNQPSKPSDDYEIDGTTCIHHIPATVTAGIAWDSPYSYEGGDFVFDIFKDHVWWAPIQIELSIPEPLTRTTTATTFNWGYCVKMKKENDGNDLDWRTFEYPPFSTAPGTQYGGYCVGFNKDYKFPLPYPNINDPANNTNLTHWDKYPQYGIISIGNRETQKTGYIDSQTVNVPVPLELFDNKYHPESGTNYYPVDRIILYNVQKSAGDEELDFQKLPNGPELEIHYK